MTTIFSLHVTLCQTARITSPRDGKEMLRMRRLVIAEKGRRVPSSHPHPDSEWPSLFRGHAAGGNDQGALFIELNGRVAENDFQVRPSATRGVDTPIHVSHALQVDIFFAVFSVDSTGKPMQRRGPGGLQVLRINRGVMFPEVSDTHIGKIDLAVSRLADHDEIARM